MGLLLNVVASAGADLAGVASAGLPSAVASAGLPSVVAFGARPSAAASGVLPSAVASGVLGSARPRLALGFAATYPYYYSGYYSDPCVVWDGYEWVNVCPYYPYYY